jgi:hypothetical protein
MNKMLAALLVSASLLSCGGKKEEPAAGSDIGSAAGSGNEMGSGAGHG